MSLGTVNNPRIEASNATEKRLKKQNIQNSPVVGADETHFVRWNVDDAMPKRV